jgi:phospholipid/cholesterol/gamma-HCH transport system ATP-binding protein
MAIIGGSGTGKSVTLKLIIGLMKPDRGEVLIDGVDLCCLPFEDLAKLRQKMGMVFQGAALFDSLNVLENVAIGLRKHRKMSDLEIRAKVRECLELVGLHDIEDQMPSELSGGMKKRVAIARAIAMDPEILLYDEPTTGLDPQRANSINDLIADLQDKIHTTSIVVTHDMNSVYRVADRVALLKDGRIHFVGTPDELRESEDPVVRNFVEGIEERDEALI